MSSTTCNASTSIWLLILLLFYCSSSCIRIVPQQQQQFNIFASGADVITTSTDDMINDLIDAELFSTEDEVPLSAESSSSSSDLLSKKHSSSSGNDNDGSDEIILLDDMNDLMDTVPVSLDGTTTTDNNSSNSNTATMIDYDNNNTTTGMNNIHVQSNLQSLSDDELIAICTERGYEITIENASSTGSNTTALTHDDYVEAAMQCLSLDKVVDEMIANNPDIAADIDNEVERIRIEKEKLQLEQDQILHEISSLEDELRQSGIDPKSIVVPKNVTKTTMNKVAAAATTTTTTTTTTIGTPTKNLTDLTVDEVLYESLVQLLDRVGQDIQFVARLVQSIVLQPLYTSIVLIWKYTSPTIISTVLHPLQLYIQHFIQQPPIQQLTQQLKHYIIPLRDIILQKYHIIRNDIVVPLLVRYNNSKPQIHDRIQLWYHQQSNEVQLGLRIIRAVVLPWYQSISVGYHTFLQPMLYNITTAIINR